MKTITKLITLATAILGISLFPLLTTGCKTLTLPDGTKTNVVDQVKLQQSAILLKSTVRSALVLVIDKNGTNATPYIRLSAETLTLFIDSDAAKTPDNLLKALSALPPKALSKAEVKLAISTTVTAYEIYYSKYVQNAVNSNEIAVMLLKAIRDGCRDAVALSP